QELAERVIVQAALRQTLNPEVTTFAAVAAHCRGIWHESTDELQTAASLLAIGPRPLAYASALEDLGRHLVQRGSHNAGVEALDEALTITTRVGANWDA